MAKIYLIGTTGLPANYGGFETLGEKLVEQLASDFDFDVFCSSSHYKGKAIEYSADYNRINLPLSANGPSSLLYDALSIIIAGSRAQAEDTLLLLGTSGAWILPLLRPFIKAQIIINVDGIEWRRNKFNNFGKLVLKKLERLAVRNSDLTICDNTVIDRYVRRKYHCKTKVIAYGGDLAREKQIKNRELGHRYALSICRIEPENNVHLILESAFRSDINLTFVGNWSASKYGKQLKEAYSKHPKFNLLDPIYDSSKLDDLRKNCYVYLHGHSAGGSNPSLIEMMFYEKPIIAYDCMFNKYTLDGNGSFFKSTSELVKILEMLKSDYTPNMVTKYKNAKSYADENYTWEKISHDYRKVFLS